MGGDYAWFGAITLGSGRALLVVGWWLSLVNLGMIMLITGLRCSLGDFVRFLICFERSRGFLVIAISIVCAMFLAILLILLLLSFLLIILLLVLIFYYC